MDKSIILEMLSKLPPERLGQLVNEVTVPQEYSVENTLFPATTNRGIGVREGTFRKKPPEIYERVLRGGY